MKKNRNEKRIGIIDGGMLAPPIKHIVPIGIFIAILILLAAGISVVSATTVTVQPGESIQEAINNLPVEGGIIELAAGTHEITDEMYPPGSFDMIPGAVSYSIIISKSNVIIQGTPDSIVKHHNKNAHCFLISNLDPDLYLENITFRGFHTTSTYTGADWAYNCIISAGCVKDFTVEDMHDTSWARVFVNVRGTQTRKSENVYYKNNYLEHCGVGASNINNMYAISNILLGSRANYALATDERITNLNVIGNRVINAGANSGLLVDGPVNCIMRDNFVLGSQEPLRVEHAVNHAIIEQNTFTGGSRYGIALRAQAPMRDVIIRNNRIYNNGWGGIWSGSYPGPWGLGDVTITNNLIHSNGDDGIIMACANTRLDLKNNIITNNSGYGINALSFGEGSVHAYNNIWGNNRGSYYATTAGEGEFELDPEFANHTNADFHLKSTGGHWNGSTWVYDDATSPCIDAGDPAFDYTNEPEPNGGRINLGAYGNTKEASKSRDAATGTISGTVTDGTNPIQGATVSVGTWSTTTNENEGYTIENVPVGNYTITASADMYDSQSKEDIVVKETLTTTVDFQLTKETTPPTIIAHSPTGISVSVDTKISVTFNEAMNKTSTQNAFSISPSVTGSFSWDRNQLIITPDSALNYETTYTVTISTEAEDLAGNNLESEYSWQFTVEKVAPHDPLSGWESEKALVRIGDDNKWSVHYYAFPHIAYNLRDDGKWVLISNREVNDDYFGYYYDDSENKWVEDKTLVNGLISRGWREYPAFAYNVVGDDKWTLISHCGSGFYGYYWDGTQWVEDSSRVNGLAAISGKTSHTFIEELTGDEKWTLITGTEDGTFRAFYWDGAQWVEDSSRVNGLPDVGSYSRVTAGFNVFGDDKWNLITTTVSSKSFRVFRWDGTQWIEDITKAVGLNTKLPELVPTLGYNLRGDGKWVLISGVGSVDTLLGFFYNSVDTPSLPSQTGITSYNVLSTTVRITFSYPYTWNHRIKYSTNPNMSDASWSDWFDDMDNADIKLEGLSPDTTYYYEVYTYIPWDISYYVKSSVNSFTTISASNYIMVNPGESIQNAIDMLPLEGGTVELAAGVHDVYDTIVINRNNITIQGTHYSVVRVNNRDKPAFVIPHENPSPEEPWSTMSVIEDLTFKGFKVTTSYTGGSGDSLVLAWNVKNLAIEGILDESHLANLIAMNPTGGGTTAHSEDIFIRNNNLLHSSIVFCFSKNVHVINNKLIDVSSMSGIDINRNNEYVYIYDNYVSGPTNYDIRAHGGSYVYIYNNTLTNSETGIWDDGVSPVTIKNNTITDTSIAAIHIQPQYPRRNVIIINNRMYKNTGHGIWTTRYTYGFVEESSDVAVINNIICNNAGDGIKMNTEWVQLNVINNIITNNGGYGINYMDTIEPTTISYNDVLGNTLGSYNGITAGTGDISEDPLFADQTKGNFHLKSTAGRCNGSNWVIDPEDSPCIDAGDPFSAYSNEPEPNGGRINMGAYGNTGEASKDPQGEPEPGDVILWDTNAIYDWKDPFYDAVANKDEWTQVPYGVTNYTWVGDPMIENEHYYLFLFSDTHDSVDLHVKIDGGFGAKNEIYKVYDTGLRDFGHGAIWTNILKNSPGEVIAESAGEGHQTGQPVVTAYHIPREHWIEIKPVDRVNQQGMHDKSRLAAFVFQSASDDIILDADKHGDFIETINPPAGCIGEINFNRGSCEFMWFLTFPPGTETSSLTYQTMDHPDCYWEWDCSCCVPRSVGQHFAYLGEKVVIGVLNFDNNWKREDVNQPISAGETYTSSFTAPYAGKWRVAAVFSGDDHYITDNVREVTVNAGDYFTFTSPRDGTLDYLVMYMVDRTKATGGDITTIMDVYRETIGGGPAPDTTSPTIITHSPIETIVPVNTTISVTFSEEMNQNSTEGAFSISPSVSGAFSWDGNKMIFTPDSNLDYETAYTVNMSTEAEDLAGNNLESEYSWQFTTSVHVSNLMVASGNAYEVVDNGLVVGARQYIDRSYTFSSVPGSITGATYIKTANNDKNRAEPDFLCFDVNQDVTIYVAHDDRIVPRPSWLHDFVDTGEDLLSDDLESSPFSLFNNDFSQGTISLGGNRDSSIPADTKRSMYTVAIVGTGSSTNHAPVAQDQSVTTDEDTARAITLVATDVDGDTVTYSVVTQPSHGTLSGTATAPNMTYTPDANYHGLDSFTFKANDGTVDTNVAIVSITVTAINDAPVAQDQSVTTDEDTAKAITLVATDVDGDTVTYSIVTQPSHGTLSGTATAPNMTYTPDANYHGLDSFTFKANDGLLDSNVATVPITVGSELIISNLMVASGNAYEVVDNGLVVGALQYIDRSYTFSSVPGSITGATYIKTANNDKNRAEPDFLCFDVNQAVTIYVAHDDRIVPRPSWLQVFVDTGEDLLSDDLESSPFSLFNNDFSQGTISLGGNRDSSIPADTKRSMYTVVIVGTGSSTNHAPVAQAQSVTTDEDTAKAITLVATDVDGDTVTYSIVTQPSHGTLSGTATAPNMTYTPDANYIGLDSFTFKANDGTVDTNVAIVSITVTAINDAPVAQDQSVTTDEDTAKAITLVATDVDGDTVTYSIVTQPSHGTLSGTATAPNKTYTPDANYNGLDSFTFKANDGLLDSNVATVSITVGSELIISNLMVASGNAYEVVDNGLVVGALQYIDRSYTFSSVPGSITGATYIKTANNDKNRAEPDFLCFDVNQAVTIYVAHDDRIVPRPSWLHDFVDTGEDLLSDDLESSPFSLFNNDFSEGTISLGGNRDSSIPADTKRSMYTVVIVGTGSSTNHAPVAQDQSVTTDEDTAKAITLVATDVDGDTVTYSIVTQPSHGTLSGTATAPNMTYTPDANYNGSDSFTFKANDGTVDTNVAIVSITVTAINDAPVAQDQSVTTDEDTAKAITLVATDVDGDTVTYSIVTQPSHGTLSGTATAPNKTYTPDANYIGLDSFTFKANDGLLDSNVATVPITVGSELIISNLMVASGNAYEVVDNGLVVGAIQYIDRSYTFSSVPGSITGATYIKTANNDKNRAEPDFLCFDVNQAVTIYVAHDDRIVPRPSWLHDFVDTGEDMLSDDPESSPFSLFNNDFPQGTITLGGNIDSSIPADTKRSMYTVVIVGNGLNHPPVADPNGPYTGTEGVPIAYDGTGSYDPDGSIVAYEWDFGDGNTATGVAPTHTYAQDGTYTVTLTVTDNDGAANTSTTTATIADTEPIADFSATPTSGQEPLTVTFTDNSTSHDGIMTWEWDFDNDGVTDSTVQNPTYAEEGVYTVSLKVNESDGDSDTRTMVDYITVTKENNDLAAEWHLDKGSGPTAVDSSGNGNDGTLVNNPAWVTGKIGKALRFDGTDDCIDCGQESSLKITGAITVEAWVKWTGAGNPYLVTKTGGPSHRSYDLSDNEDGTVEFRVGGVDCNTIKSSGTISIPAGEWVHLAGTYEPSSYVRLFVDGSLAKENNVAIPASQGDNGLPWYIGAREGKEGWFSGTIDEVKIYNRALSAEEIRTNYEAYPSNLLPTAFIDSITSDPAEQGKDTVSFTGHGTDTDGSVVAYNWSSSIDGQLSTASSFSKPASELSDGTHTIYFKVQDDDGAWSTEVTDDLTILEPANQAPVADPNGPYTGTEGVPKLFNGSGSYDSDGSIVAYEWTFGDGNNATGVTPTHIYAHDGTYTVTLTVTDNDGATDTSTTTAAIADTEPTADFSATPTSGQEPLTVTFTDNSTSHDGIVTWDWDFDNDGATESTVQNPTHEYTEDGVYTVSLKVSESDGDSDTTTKTDYITVTKVNNPPYTPAEPSPSDSATDVPVDAVLSWTGGDPDAEDTVTYDVYFGTNSNPPLTAENQPGTSYDPGTLDHSTLYYWQIVATDNHGATAEGGVWTFTTAAAPNEAPNMPAEPSPSDSATDVPVDAVLSWTGGDPDAEDTVTYDVYFGTNSNPPLTAENQPGTSYDPGTLDHSTEYYWQIVATDNHGATAEGGVWTFTTAAAPNEAPYTPAEPSPSDSATDVPIDADLSWTGGDPDAGDTVTYDVYFGTSTTPPLVAENQAGTSYDPGTLDHSTLYYWQIVATDNHGATAEGGVWTFTTAIAAPDNTPPIVSNPSATPDTILNDNGRPRIPGTNISQLSVTVTDDTEIDTVTIDLSPIGGSYEAQMTNIPGTDTWTITTNAVEGINIAHDLIVTATDTNGNSDSSVSIQLTILRRGDVDHDNDVDHADALAIKRYIKELAPDPGVFIGDVYPATGDNVVDEMDALYILEYVRGNADEP